MNQTTDAFEYSDDSDHEHRDAASEENLERHLRGLRPRPHNREAEASLMYRCGFAAGKQAADATAISIQGDTKQLHLWRRLAVAATLGLMISGPAGYWFGQTAGTGQSPADSRVALRTSDSPRVVGNSERTEVAPVEVGTRQAANSHPAGDAPASESESSSPRTKVLDRRGMRPFLASRPSWLTRVLNPNGAFGGWSEPTDGVPRQRPLATGTIEGTLTSHASASWSEAVRQLQADAFMGRGERDGGAASIAPTGSQANSAESGAPVRTLRARPVDGDWERWLQ